MVMEPELESEMQRFMKIEELNIVSMLWDG
jgi:hypothetical protein